MKYREVKKAKSVTNLIYEEKSGGSFRTGHQPPESLDPNHHPAPCPPVFVSPCDMPLLEIKRGTKMAGMASILVMFLNFLLLS